MMLISLRPLLTNVPGTGGEGIRKLDLVRWGLLDSKIEDMKKAMLYLLDGTHTIQIFDKTYEPTDFPVKVYYRYDKEGEFIDLSSANFYRNLADNPDTEVYSEANWFPVLIGIWPKVKKVL